MKFFAIVADHFTVIYWSPMSFNSNLGSASPKTSTVVAEIGEADWSAWGLVMPTAGTNWSYQLCPQCRNWSETPTVLAHIKGSFHCERCGHHGDVKVRPARFREDHISLDPIWWEQATSMGSVLKWFEAQGIDAATISQCNIGVAKTYFPMIDRWEAAFVFPCRLTLEGPPVDLLGLHIKKDTYAETKRLPRAIPVPWGWESFQPGRVILVDHPMDRLALLQAGFDSVACIPERLDPRSPEAEQDWNFLAAIEKDASTVTKFVIALHDDDRGHAIEEELARRLGKERCFRTRWQHHRPPNGKTASAINVLLEFGATALGDEIELASPFPVAGVYELMDVEDRFDVLYEFGLQRGAPTGWPSLDTHYTVMTGQWTLVTGIPGHGKSSWLDALLVNLAQHQGWKFGMFSPENQPIERHYASLMEKVARAPFNEGSVPRITPEVKDAKKSWLNEHFKVILPDDEKGNWTIDGVLSLAKTLVYRFGIKGLVIDPWNELDHSRPSAVSETDHISASLTKIRRFSRENDVHIWVVAHPAKLNRSADGKYPVPTMYDISGCHSADTEVLTDKGWIPHPLVTQEERVACFDAEENVLTWANPSEVHAFEWDSKKDGKMHRLKNEVLDALVTPNHRMVVKAPTDADWKFVQADEMKDQGLLQLPVLPYFAKDHINSSDAYFQWCSTDMGGLKPELWSQPLKIRRDVLNVLWPDRDLVCEVPPRLGRDLARLARECCQQVIERAVGAVVRLQRKVSPLSINPQTDVTLEDYQGMVYCLTVPGGAYMTRRKDKPGIYGNSAHWRNKADNGITIYRNVGEEDDDICDVHIQKIRFKEIGRVGLVSLRCDRRCGVYHDDLNQIERARAIQAGKILPSAQILVAPRGPVKPTASTVADDSDNDQFFENLFGDRSNE